GIGRGARSRCLPALAGDPAVDRHVRSRQVRRPVAVLSDQSAVTNSALLSRWMSGEHQRWVNVFLAGFLVVLAIDAFRPVNDAHQAAKDVINLPLVVTGLWQGPWRLYAPDVDKDNLRLKADLVFADQATATWSSPDWAQLSALQKFRLVRHMNYFNAILL